MKYSRYIFILFLLISLAAPFASSAFHIQGHTSLVPSCPSDGCGWNEAMLLIKSVINFLLFYISLPFAAILFAYAGILHMTSGDNPGRRTQAWKVFKNVGIGLIIALAAWLIVSTILSVLGVGQEFILLEGVEPNQ